SDAARRSNSFASSVVRSSMRAERGLFATMAHLVRFSSVHHGRRGRPVSTSSPFTTNEARRVPGLVRVSLKAGLPAGQTQTARGDDVPLNLRGTRSNRRGD